MIILWVVQREKQLEEREKLLVQRQAHKVYKLLLNIVASVMNDVVQAAGMYDVTQWTKEQVADWVYNIGTTGKNCG